MKVKKNLTLHQDQITKGVKIATLKNRSFSDMVGGLIEQEFNKEYKQKK